MIRLERAHQGARPGFLCALLATFSLYAHTADAQDAGPPARIPDAQAEPPAPPAAPVASTPTASPPATMPEPSWPVSGIYTVPDTKDLGNLTGLQFFKGIKVRGWIDAYYAWNFNHPSRSTVDANPSGIRGVSPTIQGRTFDIHDRSITLSLAEVEVEKVPEVGGAGFKFDLAFGETQDIMFDSIVAGGGQLTPLDRVFQHASLSYIAPVGRGLRFDLGKFVTHIGGETIETVKNWNYSHAFFYTYAIPFQDTGLHISYPWSDSFYTDLYVVNGWNSTVDFNDYPTVGPAIGWIASPWLSIYANYLGGPEQKNNNGNVRHLVDAQVFLGPFGGLNALINFDYGTEKIPDAAGGGTHQVSWWGPTAMLRYKISDTFEPSIRAEYYNDDDGFTTGFAQKLVGLTATLNTKLGVGKSNGGVLLVRPEFRFDKSIAKTDGTHFFIDHDGAANPATGTNVPAFIANTDTQVTVDLGIAYMF